MVGRKRLRLTTFNSLNIYGLLGAVCIFFAYGQSISFDFVNWSDDVRILNNTLFTQLESKGILNALVELLSSYTTAEHAPLTFISYALDMQFFGINKPWAWHIQNLALHILSSILVLKIAKKIGLKNIYCLLLMLLFALHPMKVESVDWVSQRGNLLFSCFYLAAILAYLKLDKNTLLHITRTKSVYVLFFAALLYKIQAITLPISLLCFDYLRKKSIDKSSLKDKIPMLIISAAFGLTGLLFITNNEVIVASEEPFSIFERLNLVTYAYLSFFMKFFIPGELSTIYLIPTKLSLSYVLSSLVMVSGNVSLYASPKKIYNLGLWSFIFHNTHT